MFKHIFDRECMSSSSKMSWVFKTVDAIHWAAMHIHHSARSYESMLLPKQLCSSVVDRD
jgi:hypothetical protein